MMLLTQENRAALPPLYTNDGLGFEAVAHVKLFHPTSRYTYFVTEFDGEDLLYGWCVSALGADCDEWGYASLAELTELHAGPFNLPMERDRHFAPQPVGVAIKEGS